MQQRFKVATVLPIIIIVLILTGGIWFIINQQSKQNRSVDSDNQSSMLINDDETAVVHDQPSKNGSNSLALSEQQSLPKSQTEVSTTDSSIDVTLLSQAQIDAQIPDISRFPKDPKRIVVMEYSFLGDLLAVDLKPIGMADDNKPNTIIPEFSKNLGKYTSVGSRYQPSLEAIADLKPDLIIADKERHLVIEDSLNEIGPAIILKSRGETYEENLQTAQLIGHIVHQDEKMAEAIESHLQHLQQIKAKLTSTPMTHKSVQFAIISDKGMWLHGPKSYAGSLITQLGLKSPIPNQQRQAYIPTSLEQLVAADPDWLLIGRYNDHTVLDDWKSSPLFQQLTAVKNNQIIEVDPDYWALNRSMQSAEHIANNLLEIAQQP